MSESLEVPGRTHSRCRPPKAAGGGGKKNYCQLLLLEKKLSCRPPSLSFSESRYLCTEAFTHLLD